jgi:hypothetical protein
LEVSSRWGIIGGFWWDEGCFVVMKFRHLVTK